MSNIQDRDGGGGVTGLKNQQTEHREEIVSSPVKIRDQLECKVLFKAIMISPDSSTINLLRT